MNVLCVIFVFFVSTSAMNLNCKFRDVQWLEVGMNYQCYSEALNVDLTQIVTDVLGVHLDNKTAEDVYSLHIDNCTNLSYIPKGLLNVFPKLRGIYLEGCAISTLSGTELDEYTQLTVFALELSPLDYVPGNLFAHTPAMRLVSFAENNITAVGRNLLSGLNELSQVYFENNICTEKNAPTPEEIPDLIAALEADCSSASHGLNSAVLLSLLLSSFAIIGKYILGN